MRPVIGKGTILLAFVGCVAIVLFVSTAYVFKERYVVPEDCKNTADEPPIQLEATTVQAPTSGVEFLGYSKALDKRSYEDTNVGGLSGLAYDPSRNLYYSLVDKEENTPARFYTLCLPRDYAGGAEPDILDVTVLQDPDGQPFTGANFDGEGIAVTSEDDLLISSETEPSIRRFSLDGRFLAELPVPQKFLVTPQGIAQRNGTFESLSLSPDGISLFTANQEPLTSDGQTSEERKRLRLLRYESQGSSGFEPSQEFSYLTEPGQGVSDIAALSESELLVLEGGHRVFRVSLDGAEDVSNEESLATQGLAPLQKELLIDLADCPLPSSAGGSLGSLESLSLGPDLPNARRALLLQGDDNFSSNQETFTIALGIHLRSLSSLSGEETCE